MGRTDARLATLDDNPSCRYIHIILCKKSADDRVKEISTGEGPDFRRVYHQLSQSDHESMTIKMNVETLQNLVYHPVQVKVEYLN